MGSKGILNWPFGQSFAVGLDIRHIGGHRGPWPDNRLRCVSGLRFRFVDGGVPSVAFESAGFKLVEKESMLVGFDQPDGFAGARYKSVFHIVYFFGTTIAKPT